MKLPTAIDLFAGAGGLSLGLINSGFDVRAAIDFDEQAVSTYRLNIGQHALCASIESLSAADLLDLAGLKPGQLDLLAGGPPCQGFSVQRRGSDEDPRNHLVLEYMRFVEELRPKFFLMENVSGLLSKRGQPFLDRLRARVESIGYFTQLAKLDAVDFGVPQYRVRAFLVGQLVEGTQPKFSFPLPTTSGSALTVRDAIEDLPSPPLDGKCHPDVANHYREARLSALNLERIKHVPQGGGRAHLPDHLQLDCHRNNPTHRHMDVYGRLAWDAPSVTLTARFDSFTRGRFAHPDEHRSLTLREGARLQTFPDNFVFLGNREECARQIGNAVPPKMAEALGKSLIRVLHGTSDTDQPRLGRSPSIQPSLFS